MGAALAAPPLAQPLEGVQPFRLALTPYLDGRLEAEEWEPFAKGTSFQWEPGSLYWSASAKPDEQIVFTLDWDGNGWLVGEDNFEVAVSNRRGELQVSVRQLDADAPMGPTWVRPNLLPESLAFAKTETADGWVLEAQYTPILGREPAEGTRFGVRVDVLGPDAELAQPYLPRAVTFVSLAFDQGRGVPYGLTWRPDLPVRSVPAGDRLRVFHNFERDNPVDFRNVEFRAEGLGGAFAATGTQPFPGFDRRNRARVPYETMVGPDAVPGWRIVQAKLTDASGKETVLRTSVKFGRLLDFKVNLPHDLKASGEARVVRGSVDLLSQSLRRLDGTLTVEAPSEWTVSRGNNSRIVIYHSRGSQRVPLEFIVPRGTEGVFPILVRAKVGEETAETRVYLPILPEQPNP